MLDLIPHTLDVASVSNKACKEDDKKKQKRATDDEEDKKKLKRASDDEDDKKKLKRASDEPSTKTGSTSGELLRVQRTQIDEKNSKQPTLQEARTQEVETVQHTGNPAKKGGKRTITNPLASLELRVLAPKEKLPRAPKGNHDEELEQMEKILDEQSNMQLKF
ncbi:hypothetical protein Q1695_012379 [Nippostrongylus brasiliensis]|nr:hypothetical protein Q1695_012379 [Nippostrongylus brasiliensis]